MKQHTTPCKSCPWRRDSRPGALGGSGPGIYIGQSVLPFWLPCHNCYDPAVGAKDQSPETCASCAGAAIYRSNIGVALPDHILTLPKDGRVFGSPEEFLAHHLRMPLWTAARQLQQTPVETLAEHALAQSGARVHLVKRRTVGEEMDEREALDRAQRAASPDDARETPPTDSTAPAPVAD